MLLLSKYHKFVIYIETIYIEVKPKNNFLKIFRKYITIFLNIMKIWLDLYIHK